MIQYYYGYGKGKTTAALGAGMRGFGAGIKVAMVQFFKDNKSSELSALPFDVFLSPDKLCFNPSKEAYIPWIKSAIEFIKNSDAQMIILDEFADLYPNYLDEKSIKSVLKGNKEFIITGHSKVEFLCDMADYVTQFNKEKHPYDKGIKARLGIEF